MLAATGVWLGGLLIAMTIVFPSITPAKMLAAQGLGSVAIGLAFKDTFESYLAGLRFATRIRCVPSCDRELLLPFVSESPCQPYRWGSKASPQEIESLQGLYNLFVLVRR